MAKTPCAPYHIRNWTKLHAHAIITPDTNPSPPLWQKASTPTSATPIKLMLLGELKFALVMGFNEVKAARLLKDVQTELMANQRIENDFGTQYAHGGLGKGQFYHQRRGRLSIPLSPTRPQPGSETK